MMKKKFIIRFLKATMTTKDNLVEEEEKGKERATYKKFQFSVSVNIVVVNVVRIFVVDT